MTDTEHITTSGSNEEEEDSIDLTNLSLVENIPLENKLNSRQNNNFHRATGTDPPPQTAIAIGRDYG